MITLVIDTLLLEALQISYKTKSMPSNVGVVGTWYNMFCNVELWLCGALVACYFRFLILLYIILWHHIEA
jgi:hypothetical protein